MVYWCKKCGVPIFDKELHECTCDGKVVKISESTICNPVFKQERKLLSRIAGEDLMGKDLWYLGGSNYYYDGKINRISYRDWYKNKEHLSCAEEFRQNIEIEDYEDYQKVVQANETYIKNIVFEAEQYIYETVKKYPMPEYIPTISFSGGKDSSVVSRIVMDTL